MAVKNIFEIIKLFEENNIPEILEYCKPYFKRIDQYSYKLTTDEADNISLLDKILTRAGGYKGLLAPISALAEAYVKNRKAQYHVNRVASIERGEALDAAGKPITKVVATLLAVEADHEVRNERRLRNVLQGYVESCNSIISTIQSRKKNYGAE